MAILSVSSGDGRLLRYGEGTPGQNQLAVAADRGNRGGSVASVFASPILIRHLPPSLVNLPNRDYWLANEERREVAIDRVGSLLGWVGMATALLLAMVIELAMQANLHRSNLDNGAFMTVLVAYFAFVIAVFIRKMRLLKLPE